MPQHRRHATILFGLLLAVAPIASAFQPLITDDTGTQGTAGNQIEFSWNLDRAEVAGDTTRMPFGAIHANLVAGRFHFRDAAIPDVATTRASVAPVWEVAEGWQLAADIGTETASAGGERLRTGFVEAGAIYSPNEDLDVALGVIRSSANDSPRTTTTSATLGVTWRFK